MKKVQYIAESGEFIVNGKVIKESTLTEEEKRMLHEQCTNVQIITGSRMSPVNNLIV